MSFDSILDKLKNERDALSSILIIIGILLLAMVLGNIIAAVFMIVIGGIGVDDLADINGALMSSSSGWWALMIGQGVASILTFILAGVFYWKVVEKKDLTELNFKVVDNLKIFGLVILTQLCFLPLNSWFQEINAAMQLPEALSGVEKFMKSMEDSLAEMTEYLTQFDTLPKVIVGFFVIAIVAGVGEELIFRGLIQRKLWLKGVDSQSSALLKYYTASGVLVHKELQKVSEINKEKRVLPSSVSDQNLFLRIVTDEGQSFVKKLSLQK